MKLVMPNGREAILSQEGVWSCPNTDGFGGAFARSLNFITSVINQKRSVADGDPLAYILYGCANRLGAKVIDPPKSTSTKADPLIQI